MKPSFSHVTAVAFRPVLGASIFVAGSLVLLAAAVRALPPPAAAALMPLGASAIAGAATGLGALVLLAPRRAVQGRLEPVMLAAAGMMFAAALLSLLFPALRLSARGFGADALGGLLLGYGLMALLDRSVPHAHAVETTAARLSTRAAMLVVAGIAIHNLPEGFAVGAGFGGGDSLGWSTALSIGIQNVPEGAIVAIALYGAGLSRRASAAAALGTGLIEPIGAAAGVALIAWAPAIAPVAMSLAAGAMVFIVFNELLPQARRNVGMGRVPVPFVAGFGAMVALAGLG